MNQFDSIIYILLPVLAVIVGLIRGGFKIKAYAPFIWFLVYSSLHQMIMIALAGNGIRNIFMGNIFNAVSTFMLADFFLRLFFEGKTPIKWYLLVCLPSVVLYITNIDDFNKNMLLLDLYYKMGVSLSACVWLIKLMLNTHVSPLRIPSFWFSISLILFNLGTVIVFNMTRFWDAGAGQWLIDIYKSIIFINIVVYYSLIIIGILCISKKSTSKFSY